MKETTRFTLQINNYTKHFILNENQWGTIVLWTDTFTDYIYSNLGILMKIDEVVPRQLAQISQELLEEAPSSEISLIVNPFSTFLGFSLLESTKANGIWLIDSNNEPHLYGNHPKEPWLFSPMDVAKKWLLDKEEPTLKHMDNSLHNVQEMKRSTYWCECDACIKNNSKSLQFCEGEKIRLFENVTYNLN